MTIPNRQPLSLLLDALALAATNQVHAARRVAEQKIRAAVPLSNEERAIARQVIRGMGTVQEMLLDLMNDDSPPELTQRNPFPRKKR